MKKIICIICLLNIAGVLCFAQNNQTNNKIIAVETNKSTMPLESKIIFINNDSSSMTQGNKPNNVIIATATPKNSMPVEPQVIIVKDAPNANKEEVISTNANPKSKSPIESEIIFIDDNSKTNSNSKDIPK